MCKKVTNRLIIAFLLLPILSFSQAPKRYTSAEIHAAIKKLNFLGSMLYVAAHPDDENTRLISYFSNEINAHTTYLSLTRGDGGQNMIGTELKELLGALRTQELLAARRVDGGNQTFSRANDFGYSKHPDETLKIWNKEEVLSDVVWAIRKFQPDVIINRFDHRTPGRTHGHHTSSAMLSVEAFDLSNDPSIYPDQLTHYSPWQAKRLFMNTSWWFYGSREKFAKADKSNMLSVDAGVYYPMLGKSNSEIAAESRSMHKCQGFGSTGTRGSELEYLELIKGDLPEMKEDLFEGVNTSWTRVAGGEAIGKLIKEIDAEFNNQKPSASVPKLMQAYQMIQKLEDSKWKSIKSAEIEKIVAASTGLFLEAVANAESAVPGEEVELAVEYINRSNANIVLKKISITPDGKDTTLFKQLENNTSHKEFINFTIPKDMGSTSPYWLQEKGTLGMYNVQEQSNRGIPEIKNDINVAFDLNIGGTDITLYRNLVFKKNDRVRGEVYQPFEIVSPVSASIDNEIFIFADNEPQTINISVKAYQDNLNGTVELCHPNTWRVEPKNYDVSLESKGEEASFSFELYPSTDQEENFIVPLVKIGENSYTDKIVKIDYEHVPLQTIAMDASVKVVKLDIKKEGENIAYIMGAGDKVPESLRQIGYNVDLVPVEQISTAKLLDYDACVVGIRAYNVEDELKFKHKYLLEYVEQGGTLIIQYNTTRGLNLKDIGPYPMTLGRGRVSVEEAEVRVLLPDHVALNYPNKITSADFDNWVQERGLYFPEEWDDKYAALLSSNDPGEDPRDGSLLITEYGNGYFVYSGLSWFRELPAGVPGAYRLFANLLSLRQANKP